MKPTSLQLRLEDDLRRWERHQEREEEMQFNALVFWGWEREELPSLMTLDPPAC